MKNSSPFNGHRAAVSLTYDDCMDCHLDLVAPALEARGFRGTFYTPVNAVLMERMDEWAAAARRGHELGNHTLFHPCRSYGGGDWIKPWRDLKAYDLPRWEAEVDLANLILNRIEGRTDRSFGNTCHQNTLGPDENPERLDEHMLPRFVAARGTKRDVDESIDPANLTPGNLGTLGGDGLSLDALKALVDMAVDRGHWIILTFHGVAQEAGRLTIAESTHSALLDHCAAHGDDLQIAPVREVMAALTSAE
ncbi:MAG: polysaccharide deacetylase family protein [Kiritimatiellae bacterium]|nr:polysaccharide deacetylase family protein [Kiritimatiellia bacterium]